MHLADFCDWLNNKIGGDTITPELAKIYGQSMEQSINRHFNEERAKNGLRMSNLGKPAVILALAKLGYYEPEPAGVLRFIFHLGDVYENFIEIMMQAYGITILESQPLLEWHGIQGHADFVIESPVTGEPLLVEAKTMSDNYFRRFSKKPDDDRGYVTQLALYQNALGCDTSWLAFNKGKNINAEFRPDYDLFQMALVRAERVYKRVERVNTIDDVLKLFRPPPPGTEMFQKKPTGMRILPDSMAWSPFATALYKTSDGINNYGKPRVYVHDIANTEHMVNQLDYLVESGVLVKV